MFSGHQCEHGAANLDRAAAQVQLEQAKHQPRTAGHVEITYYASSPSSEQVHELARGLNHLPMGANDLGHLDV